ncbi:MAG: hypothetical protein E6Q98_01295 [Rhodospirillaceae bacterium]|nr:MAG: hypothetical protein E6Q98_01295 [Rhodospirillaceae bacterium]
MAGNSGGRNKQGSGSTESGKGPGGGSAGGGSKDDCDLSFRTSLQGLDPAVVKKLKKGDVLSVDKVDSNLYSSVVCRIITTGETVGSLASSDKALALIDCIDLGHVYRAKVVDVTPGCSVQVSRYKKGATQ